MNKILVYVKNVSLFPELQREGCWESRGLYHYHGNYQGHIPSLYESEADFENSSSKVWRKRCVYEYWVPEWNQGEDEVWPDFNPSSLYWWTTLWGNSTFLRLFTKLITYFFIYSQDAETIERLNESGELRKLLRAYKVSLLLKNIELLTNLRNIHRILMHAIHVKCAEDTDFCHAESAMEARSRSIETILPLSLLH